MVLEEHTLHHNHSSSSSSNEDHFAIFPPFNHEDLPIPPPQRPPQRPPRATHAPPPVDSNHPPSSSPPPKWNAQLSKWVDFALHYWHSKLLSFLPCYRMLLPFLPVGSFLVLFWFWVRRRRRVRQKGVAGGKESVESLKILIKQKDEKIIQLLEQIAQMNKVLLAQYRIPVVRPS